MRYNFAMMCIMMSGPILGFVLALVLGIARKIATVLSAAKRMIMRVMGKQVRLTRIEPHFRG